MHNDNVQNEKQQSEYLFPQMKVLLPKIPVYLLVPIIYVVIGVLTHVWHPTWLMFLLVPIYIQLYFAFCAKNMKSFLLRMPVVFFAVLQFLTSGLFFGLWSVAWLSFLIIPIYYWFVAVWVKKK